MNLTDEEKGALSVRVLDAMPKVKAISVFNLSAKIDNANVAEIHAALIGLTIMDDLQEVPPLPEDKLLGRPLNKRFKRYRKGK